LFHADIGSLSGFSKFVTGISLFFEEIGAMSPQQPQDILRVLEIAKKSGLESLPPPGARAPG
jgi:hypothetical protein